MIAANTAAELRGVFRGCAKLRHQADSGAGV